MKLHVANLSKATTDAQLNDLATEFGKPISSVVVRDKRTGESRGFGFVEFPTEAEANAAIGGLDGREVDGQPLKVSAARIRPETARV
jgi:RNA recognition motif-containing protein